MDEKAESILKYGKYSPYWNEFAHSLPWGEDSSETQLYLAGTLNGFSNDHVLQIMEEQAFQHGNNFQNQGFFIWVEFFEREKEKGISNNVHAPRIKIKVRAIPFSAYERVAINKRDEFQDIFLDDGKLDIEFLRAIHFNATRSMSTAEVEIGDDMNAFITGTLVGCIAVGKDEVIKTNQLIRASGQD